MANRNARYLRRNMTDAEHRMWAILRRKAANGFRFRRQQPIGPYIADFYCPSAKLVIEMDGSGHAEELQAFHDEIRSRWLASRGIRVLRFWNNELNDNPDGVKEAIWEALLPLPACAADAAYATFPLKGGRGVMGFGAKIVGGQRCECTSLEGSEGDQKKSLPFPP